MTKLTRGTNVRIVMKPYSRSEDFAETAAEDLIGVSMSDWNIEILRYPTEEDWKRCLLLARCTQGKFDAPKEPSLEWKQKILRSEHSPIRTLMFTIKMEDIPYCNSVHFVRHKYGVEHYVQSQRKNPERGAERQDAPVTHIMDINAQELIFMARKRLCYKADKETRAIMRAICGAIYDISDEQFEIWGVALRPACGCNERNCHEFKPCGMYHRGTKYSDAFDAMQYAAQWLTENR